MKKYEDFSDEELVMKIQKGESEILEFLMDKYKFLVRNRAKAMFLIGGENDDLLQEGMIGLFKAVRDYAGKKEVPFAAFADLCVSRQIYSAVQASRRQKHIPLNSYISLYEEAPTEEGSHMPMMEMLEAIGSNPEELIIDKESVDQLQEKLEKVLSRFEQDVFSLYLVGNNGTQIAHILDKNPKSVDNALQRVKTKAGQILQG